MSKSSAPTDISRPAQFILHPTDFSQQSALALAHALRLALSNSANVEMLHVGKDTDDEWSEFPSIRSVLQRWGMIADSASRSDVADLGIGIRKVIGTEQSVTSSIEGYCQRRPIDLIVLATAGRHGLAGWLKPSTAERIAEKTHIPTLFVPADCRGCVSLETGEVSMNHVLVPVDHEPNSDVAVERGLRAISMYGGDRADLTLMHVGSESRFPEVEIPDGPWQVKRVARQGNPADEILAEANQCNANLIIMVTEGSHGFLDVLRGTTTERVLRYAPCPVLAVPAHR